MMGKMMGKPYRGPLNARVTGLIGVSLADTPSASDPGEAVSSSPGAAKPRETGPVSRSNGILSS